MTAFKLFERSKVYTDLTGKLAVGGNLHFYIASTTTDADVFGDEALTVNNGPIIAIGTDGRAVDAIWGDGTTRYDCRIYAADGTHIVDEPDIGLPGSGSATLPAMVAGEFLTTDGANWLMAAVRQALDPTGAANKVMGSDGTNLLWVDKPANGANGAAGTNAAVTVTPTSVKWSNGTGDLFFIQGSSDSAPASGVPSTSKSITFATPFKTLLGVYVISTSNAYATDGKLVIPAITSKTTSGFTVGLDTNTTTDNVFAAVPFDWIAFGTVAS